MGGPEDEAGDADRVNPRTFGTGHDHGEHRMGNIKEGDRVKHRELGWFGTVRHIGPFGHVAQYLVEVQPVQGAAARWFRVEEFEPAQAATEAQTPNLEADIFRPMRAGFGAGIGHEVERPAGARSVRERYLTDAAFHHLVDTMLAAIKGGVYTPSEVREAAILAQVIHESETVRDWPVGPDPRG